MIISASRRTDIPAFYSKWFINRIHAGYCTVPNPFNKKQVATVSLKPENVDVIVFWTRNPLPLIPYLPELTKLGYKFYFLYTVMNNPKQLDPFSPKYNKSIETFKKLADIIGHTKVIWRYDPIVFSNKTDIKFHKKNYKMIGEMLKGFTIRSVISIVNIYRKNRKRISLLSDTNFFIFDPDENMLFDLLPHMVNSAKENGMEIFSCAEDHNFVPFGINPGKCIDNKYIKSVFNIDIKSKKDPGQRKACGCVVSKDIGMYDSCIFGCCYCYACKNFKTAYKNYKNHNPDSLSLL